MGAYTTHNSSCVDHITSRGIAGSTSCHGVSLSGSPIISSRQSSCTLPSPRQSVCFEMYPMSPSVYSLTSAPTSDCESPPETPARNRSGELSSLILSLFCSVNLFSVFNLARIPDRIPETNINESDIEDLFALNHHQHGPKERDDSGHSAAVRFSFRRRRRKLMESKHRSCGDEPSPEPPTDTTLTPDSGYPRNNMLGDGTCSESILRHPVGSNSHVLGDTPPRASHSPIIEFAAFNQVTPTQEALGRSTANITIPPRPLKRARCPPPLDIKSISSYDIFVSQGRGDAANEMKPKKTITGGLGLGLPSIPGGPKPTRTRESNGARSTDVVGPIHPIYRPWLQKWRSSSLPASEAPPGPASTSTPLQFPLAPRLRPIDTVDPLNDTPSPLELPSPPTYNANNWKSRSAPACQLYFNDISRSRSARTDRPLSAKAPTPTATPSHPSAHTRKVVPSAYRRASSYLKDAIASLPRSALHSPIPPSLVGTPYLESISSPFSPHFRPLRNNRRAASASEWLRRDVSVDVDTADEHWIDVNVPSPGIPPQLSGSSSLTARQRTILGERDGKGPSGRRRKKSPRQEGKTGCNPYFADAEHTHSALFTVPQSA